ncbi:GATA-domain-containing protein [Sistotremastrum suecicum HHB10207 ss-3]|uniref:GATA-domain-containing protein n=1 Tax=Sistotremastrum suecicum HHB10207 ss-3 TaxID=1314776 RepID=A0A166E5Z3_9AGAM|nr:GATA-domain-containing protein [Sistotremastrum suecicum HHB10207 ss-3]
MPLTKYGTTLTSMSATTYLQPAARPTIPPVFDFTKRKRWDDLLLDELSENIILVLSLEAKVLFCGNAVTELLGYNDDDLVDSELIEIMNKDDAIHFQRQFEQSVQAKSDISSFVRLKCKAEKSAPTANFPMHTTQKEQLFEIRVHPYNRGTDGTADRPACMIAMAKPYPSTATATLNGFLELKIENERLTQRLAELKSMSAGSSAPTSSIASASAQTHVFSDGPGEGGWHNAGASSLGSNNGGYLGLGTNAPDEGELGGRSGGTMHGGMVVHSGTVDEEGDENGQKKKKAKKGGLDQYVCVTCGRTDSPEWRKGPQGPKTLCNACGLRWAKRARKVDVEADQK